MIAHEAEQNGKTKATVAWTVAFVFCGGDGGNRTRVRNTRSETSTSLVTILRFAELTPGDRVHGVG